MKTTSRWICSALIAGSAAGATHDAQAQAPASNGAPESAVAEIGEILVTAQKRSERLQDVPIQIDVVTADDIQARQIRQTLDIVRTIPNLAIQRTDTYTNSVVTLRGISQASNSDAPVAVIVDGIPQDDAKQLNMRLFDIQQIEVLKGPQGSIYGRNAEAGAIIITTAEPTEEFHGFGNASFGNGKTADISGGVSGSFVPDRVQYRLAGSYLKSDGVIPNTYRGVKADQIGHDWTVRGSLYFQLTESAKLSLIASHSDFNAAGVIFAPVFSGSANDFVDPQSNFPNRGSGTSTNIAAKLDINLGFANFSSISGYSKLDQIQTTDVDFTPLPIVGDNQPYNRRIVSQEFRFVGPDTASLRWLASFDYLHSSHFVSTDIFLDRGNPAVDPTDPTALIVSNPEDDRRTNYGASAQLDYKFQNNVTVTAGVRYDRDERTQIQSATGNRAKATFDDVQPRVSVAYQFDRNRQVYATYGVGFRSGGFNPPGFPLTQAEKLSNFEVGAKSQWLDGRLTLNGALFVSNVDDFQFSYIDFNSASEVTGNIDKVRITGAELEIRAVPAEGLNFFANAGLAKSNIRELPAFPQFVGNHTPRSSNLSLNAGMDYTHKVNDQLSLFLRVDLQHYGKRYWYTDNLDVQDPKTFTNMSIGVRQGPWVITAWGKNLSNTRAYDTYFPGQSTGLPYDVAFPTAPRTYGIELATKF